MSRNEVVRKRNKDRTIVTCAGGAHDGGEEGVGEHRAPVHHQLEVRATTCLKTIFCKPADLIEVHSSDLPKSFFNMIKIADAGVKDQFQFNFKSHILYSSHTTSPHHDHHQH